MRPKHALALEPDLLGDALRRDVVCVSGELNTRQLQLLERVSRQETYRPSANALAPRGRRDPVANAPAKAARAQAEPDSPDDTPVQLDRERLVIRSHFTADESARVLGGVWVRNRGDPARDLGIVAPGDHRIDVFLGPRPQQEIAVAEFHADESRSTGTLTPAGGAGLRPAGAQARPVSRYEEEGGTAGGNIVSPRQ